MGFQLSGNTGTVPLPAVLQILQLAEVSGTLTVRQESIEKCIHVKGGQIIFATSNDSRDRLGEILVKANFLTLESLAAGLALFKKQSGVKKIGAILVEHKFVSPKDLYAGFKIQVKEIIYSMFLWDNAEYQFEEVLPGDVIQLQISLQEMIAEIIQRIKQES